MQFGYYINLERMTARREFMDSQLSVLGLENVFARWAGVDAVDLRLDSVENYAPGQRGQDPQPPSRWSLSGVEVAIFESHRRIWEDMARKELPYAIILEDDMKLSASLHDVIEQIETISSAVDVLKLDRVRRPRRFGSPLAGSRLEIRPIKWQRVYSCGAYLVSREGAKKLLHWSTSYSDLVDAFVFGPRRNYRLYQLFPAIALQGHVMRNLTSHEDVDVPTGSVPDVGVQRTPASKGPLWFRLMREARLGLRTHSPAAWRRPQTQAGRGMDRHGSPGIRSQEVRMTGPHLIEMAHCRNCFGRCKTAFRANMGKVRSS